MVGSPIINVTTDVTFDGKVPINNNKNNGILIRNLYYGTATVGTILVTGELNTERNGLNGVEMGPCINVNVVLGNKEVGTDGRFPKTVNGFSSGGISGSITACENNYKDIVNDGNGTFQGADYTCILSRMFHLSVSVSHDILVFMYSIDSI